MPKQSRPHSSLYLRLTCFALSRRFTQAQIMAAVGVSDKTVQAFLRNAQDEGVCRIVGTARKPAHQSGTAAYLYEFSNPFVVNSETLKPFVDMAPTTDVKLAPSTTPSEHLHAPSKADPHTEAPTGAR